ncbi:hypothetical protein VMCG_10186 [Cytospora schulzeri]|uniref:Heterokaryon incompatibility domain-containing protein n=1 Tax=Cytospora schulzeri TaxID=448051 RepID=A0A423VCZ0_9PEZI|nr:hypothetical protein VMCG_10186 [Valsa malicola]
MAYQYKPLRKGPEIRLLEIKPLRDGTTSPFSLQIYDFSRLPPFEAISYTWGRPDFDSSITCDGKCLPITKNCATVLKYLRREAAWARRVWIDQICINQNDMPERSDQVLLMTEIYSRAQQVIAWIGECDEDERRCLELLATLDITRDMIVAADNYARNLPWGEEPHIGRSGIVCLESPELEPWLEEGGWAPVIFRRLVSRPYFKRLWIVQELTVARRVTLKCGEYSLDMQQLFNMGDLHSILHKDMAPIPYWLLMLGYLRRKYVDYGTVDWDGFQETSMFTWRFEVTDTRDKVYALRGISKVLKENTPLPDYNKSDVEIFIETAKATTISDRGRLSILSADRTPRHGADLPTWCPDYGQSPGSVTLCRSEVSRRLREKLRLSNSQPVFDGNRFIVRGKSFDSIAELSEVAMMENAKVMNVTEVLRSWLSFMQPATSSYGGKEPMHLAFWSTMLTKTESWADLLLPMHSNDTEHSSQFIDDLHKLYVEGNYEGATYINGRIFIEPEIYKAMDRAWSHTIHMRACVTEEKFFGLVPRETKVGDLLFYLAGAEKLYLLRPQDGSEDVFKLVGSGFVQGLSDGERYSADDSEMREIVIV